MFNWLKKKVKELEPEPKTEYDKSRQVAIEVVQFLLDEARIAELTPPGYEIKLRDLLEGGAGISDNHIECSFTLYLSVTAPNNGILRQTLEENRRIAETYTKRVKEMEEKIGITIQ